MTQDELKSLFIYNPETGVFISKKSGRVIGSERHGYINIAVFNKLYKAHRLAMFYMGIYIPDNYIVDHIDGNGSNNSFSNLRVATRAQNTYNRKINKNNTSGFKGVYWIGRLKKWVASFQMEGTKIYLGMFETPEEAFEAVKIKREEVHGIYARHA